MPPVTRRLVVCVLVLLLTALLSSAPLSPAPSAAVQGRPNAPAAPQSTGQDGSDRVSLQQVRPSSLRQGRPISLAGVVRNTTDENWSEVQVSMVISESPMPTREALAQARAETGSIALRQVLQPGDFHDLGDIAPGGEATFSLRNNWAALPITGTSGAYLVGVEVRAFEEDGLRSTVAETSAFVPLVGPAVDAEPVQMGMVLPLTAAVPRRADGFANDSLARQFGENGRLTALTELGSTAGSFPLTWAVDPAVLDAANDMSSGYRLAGEDTVAEDDERALAAARWLEDTRAALNGADLLTLPYGDPDVASLARNGQESVLSTALAAGSQTLTALDLPEQTLLWPAHGWVDRRSLAAAGRLSPAVALVAEDSLEPSDPPTAFPVSAGESTASGLSYDRRVVSPRHGETTLQWRQHLLSSAALQALHGGGPMVVVPPRSLTPSADWAESDFFGGLDAPWLRPTALGEMTDEAGRAPPLHYPRRASNHELPPANIAAITGLASATRTLIGVLADPAETQQLLGEVSGIAASVHWRDAPRLGRGLTRTYVEMIRGQLDEVRVEAPPLITLSGREGQFPVTVSNGLTSEAITVSVEVQSTNDALRVEPVRQVTIEPEQRRSIPVRARYPDEVGISTVTVQLLDQEGATFGPAVELRVRTTQIGTVIWVVMAVAGAIILAAAARSILRRVRRRDGGGTSA
jgi:hypothetical protein